MCVYKQDKECHFTRDWEITGLRQALGRLRMAFFNIKSFTLIVIFTFNIYSQFWRKVGTENERSNSYKRKKKVN